MRGQFYTTQQLGAKQSLTPEGFLLCEGVPLARTGEMLYGPGELPDDLPLGPDGYVHVVRTPEEVFRPEFVLSFAGKPLVDAPDHPEEDVNPSNWRTYARGTVMNPRRGEGAQDDLLIGDIIISDAETIAAVRSKAKREVSCGYAAEYELLEGKPGYARQFSMMGNHVALVDNGRCGSRCAIQDHKPVGAEDMRVQARVTDKKGTKHTWLDKLLSAFKDKDEKKMEEAIGEAKDALEGEAGGAEGEEHIHIHANGGSARDDEETSGRLGSLETGHAEMRSMLEGIQAQVTKMLEHLGLGETEGEGESAEEQVESELAEEAPVGTGDKAKRAKDSAFLADSLQEAVSGAEILAPGISVPTYDRAAKPQATLKAVTDLRRAALGRLYATTDGKALVDSLQAGRPLTVDCLSADALRVLFRSVVALRKQVNAQDQRGGAQLPGAGGGLGVKGKIQTNAELNAANAAFYAKK